MHFRHAILDEAPGDSLTQEQARPVAERFLTERMGFDLSRWESIEVATEEKLARVDHVFTFRKHDFEVGEDGHYRLSVRVQGGEVGGFREFLRVPESFARNYEEVRSRANLLNSGPRPPNWSSLSK